MGGIFTNISRRSLPDIYIDLENALPKTESERVIYNEFKSTCYDPSESIFTRFSNYKDGQALAAAALTNPSQEAKDAAWEMIYPNIVLQMEVFTFAKTITDKFLNLIKVTLDSEKVGEEVLSSSPSILKCFVDCFDIILKFDEIKLTLPKLLNDLAFFRRNAALKNEDSSLDDLIEQSNMSTIFWAASTPMLSDVIGALQAAYPPTSPQFPGLIQLLGIVADVCTAIGTTNKTAQTDQSEPLSNEANLLCLRCIVGATLMIDYLDSANGGAFTAHSAFHVKEGMELLLNFEPKQNGLINAILYSSKHLKDATTDPKITALFPK